MAESEQLKNTELTTATTEINESTEEGIRNDPDISIDNSAPFIEENNIIVEENEIKEPAAAKTPMLVDSNDHVTASTEAIGLINSVSRDVWRYISFSDEMAVCMQKPRELEAGLMPIGSYLINVEPTWYMDRDCYKVTGSLKYKTADFTSRFSMVSYVTPTFRTLHETRSQVFMRKQQVVERKSDLVYSGEMLTSSNSHIPYKLSYSRVLTNPQAFHTGQYNPEVNVFNITAPPGFLSEGASLMFERVLIRHLANNSLPKDILNQLKFVVMIPITDGTEDIITPPKTGPPLPAFLSLLAPPPPPAKNYMSLANLVYSMLPPRNFSVKEKDEEKAKILDFETVGFEKLFQPGQRDIPPTVSFAYHLMDGHLAVQLQAGSPYQLQIQKSPLLVPEDKFLSVPDIPRKELDWEGDAQLQAVFTERADELKNDFLSFIRHKPELRALLADFLQALLLRKPDNVIAFAAQYFSAFGSFRPLSSEVATR